MKLSFTLCLILLCVGLSVVTEAKRTTKSRSYSSTKTFYSSSKQNENNNNDDDKTYCELLDLPQACTFEYNPVCAHIRGCKGDSCFETAGNVCAACKDGKIDYFTSGECPQESENEEEESGSGEVRCELVDIPEVCPMIYDPVCAYLRNCEGDSCYETVGNGCQACGSEGKYESYIPGECPGGSENEEEEGNNDEILCALVGVPVSEVCPLIYSPVCAHLDGCEGDSCYETVGNSCQACDGRGKYDSYVPGECPGGSENEEESNTDETRCELVDVPEVCPMIYDPVCAHLRDCEGNSCYETVGNGCQACSSGAKYDSYVSGECPVESEHEEEESSNDEVLCAFVGVSEVCPMIYSPVCAHIDGCEGDSCYETVGNSCQACDGRGKYDSYVPGECPSDRLYCEVLDVSEVCPMIYDPVCAHLRDCEGDSCDETVGNGCTACSSEGKYDSFVPGECHEGSENEEEESNTDETLCELVDIPQVCPLIYDPVCAHLRDCEGDSCYETVGNGCQACGSEGKYDSYVPGECPGGSENEEEESNNDETLCELVDVLPVCPQIYDPVCAHRRDCDGDYCSETVGNGCVACSSEGAYVSYVPGECKPQSERKYCDANNRPEICTEEYFPVCAHHENDDSFKTAGNKCNACGQPDVDYYTFGAC